MHIHQLEKWRHDHDFINREANVANERRTLYVVLLTSVMMVIEVAAGLVFNSMALLADGWHMATHAGALGIAVVAYRYARYHSNDNRFTFGVGKVELLGGYTSAIILGVVALLMIWESFNRLLDPLTISFDQAMIVAVIGLAVNLVSAWLLHGGHGHGHGHHHDHGSHHHHHAHTDHNLRGAYLHVMADALTSVLAILALLCGKLLGWIWMDAAMGIVGALVISRWAISLLRDTGRILLDSEIEEEKFEQVRKLVEADADNRVVDLHLWRMGSQHIGAIVALVTHYPQLPEHYKRLLSSMPEIAHMTVEVNVCQDEPCIPVDHAG